ncbi:accessory Sec system protein translocase subunit SecY2 [Streptococcus halichoeri]|uniref:accessory Sec system protein translocase subunit SecY2 n=1 Tax=Streptococcus halichoeri TaxID=254785 RepID=UPI001357E9C8|nr:accessory Sec system protein translocase subunit SecY2 [Streptococcus halichoeri]
MKHSLLSKKIAWTFGMVFVYMLGRAIPVGTVPLDAASLQPQANKDLLAALASVSGGHYEMMTLFSLGIAPYMTMLILWRSLTVFKLPGLASLTKKASWFWQNALALGIATIQAFGLTATLTYVSFAPRQLDNALLGRFATMVVLVAGSMVLTWLTQVNTRYGLGGPVVIILVNMCLNLLQNGTSFLAAKHSSQLMAGLAFAGFALLLVGLAWWTVLVYRAEYRIPLRRVVIHSRFEEATYLPIRLLPAGGMPFMYSMTLMTLPALILQGLLGIFPTSSLLQDLLANSNLDSLPGALCYLVILYVLSIGFAYFNYDAQEIAKNFQRGGDYIEQVRPGKATYRYIERKLSYFAHIGAVLITLMGGLPILLNFFFTEQPLAFVMMISNGFIIVSLMMTVIEQIEALRVWQQYEPLI